MLYSSLSFSSKAMRKIQSRYFKDTKSVITLSLTLNYNHQNLVFDKSKTL